jgi:EamA-like transporter family
MMALLIILLMIIALDMAALLWGVDSLDGINSLEWLRRQQWYGFH